MISIVKYPLAEEKYLGKFIMVFLT
jgi:hypothetical protein